MGVIPAGASSVFARQLRLARGDAPAAAGLLAEAIAAGRWRQLGLGSANGPHVHVLGRHGPGGGGDHGSWQELRERRPDGRRPGDLAVVSAAWRTLRHDRFALPVRMTVAAAGQRLRGLIPGAGQPPPYTYFGRLPVRTTPRAGLASALDAAVIGGLRGRDLWRLPVYGLPWPRHARGGDAARRLPARCRRGRHRPATSRCRCSWTASTWAWSSAAAVRYHPAAVRVLIRRRPEAPSRAGAGSGRYVTGGPAAAGCGNSAIRS